MAKEKTEKQNPVENPVVEWNAQVEVITIRFGSKKSNITLEVDEIIDLLKDDSIYKRLKRGKEIEDLFAHLISQDTSLSEIILSGGDPLSLSHEMLSSLLLELDKIPHLRRISRGKKRLSYLIGPDDALFFIGAWLLNRLHDECPGFLNTRMPTRNPIDDVRKLNRLQFRATAFQCN